MKIITVKYRFAVFAVIFNMTNFCLFSDLIVYMLLLLFIIENWRIFNIALFIGIFSNFIVTLINKGMPVPVCDPVKGYTTLKSETLLPWLGDIFMFNISDFYIYLSIGDFFIFAGLFIFIVKTSRAGKVRQAF